MNTGSYLFFQITQVTENLTHVSSEYGKLLAEKEQTERTVNEQIRQQLEKITLLNQEKDELQQMVETCKAERHQLEADCQESKERVRIKSLKSFFFKAGCTILNYFSCLSSLVHSSSKPKIEFTNLV